jgi:hypothetical protein
MYDINYRVNDATYAKLVQGDDDWTVLCLVEGELIADYPLSKVTAQPGILPFPPGVCQDVADWAFDAWGVAADMDVRESAMRCWDGETERAWMPS